MITNEIDIEANLLKNAGIVLEVSCHVKAGESVLIIVSKKEGDSSGPNLREARALAQAAVELGAYPAIIDVIEFASTPYFKTNKGIAPLTAAFKEADVIIAWTRDYKRLGLYENDSTDVHLIGKGRRMILQPYMHLWELNAKEVADITKWTNFLEEKVKKAKKIRVTSPAGTDFEFEPLVGQPILGIIPCYGEIAIMPKFGSGNGVVVVDGPTQLKVRPADETDREPLVINVKDGLVTGFTGDAEQVARLDAYIHSQTPPATSIDEVGIPTTRVEANNLYCWPDKTHNGNTIHIALGNNELRSDIVHGKLHIDTEIINPTLYIDGEIVMENKKFISNDSDSK